MLFTIIRRRIKNILRGSSGKGKHIFEDKNNSNFKTVQKKFMTIVVLIVCQTNVQF